MFWAPTAGSDICLFGVMMQIRSRRTTPYVRCCGRFHFRGVAMHTPPPREAAAAAAQPAAVAPPTENSTQPAEAAASPPDVVSPVDVSDAWNRKVFVLGR